MGAVTDASAGSVFDWFARTKSERIGIDFHIHIFKAGGRKPVRKCLRIDHDKRVEEMHKTKETAIEAIRSSKNAAWPQGSPYLCQEPILQLLRGNVVKHCETDRRVEAGIG